MKKNLLLRWAGTLLILFALSPAFAQNKTISGTIKDNQDGTSIAGASVLVKGTTIGGKTDGDGHFSISAPQSAETLVISFIGYTNQEIAIAGRSSITVALVPSNTALKEIQVVAIGYGTARKRDLVSSVATITAKDFNKGLITAPDQLLQGKVAGLEITQNSAAPGSASTIVIRGNGSLRSGDAPLYVVDGVPLDGRSATPGLNISGGGYGSAAEVNPLLYINPNDIAQIDVLKDASATAIYGSRGANGVIVITTKRAASGTGTHLEFGTNFSSNVGYMKKYKVFDAAGYRSALNTYGIANQKNPLDDGGSSDALKSITQNTLSQDYHLALTGGNEDGRFRASFLGSQNKGFIRNTSLAKFIGTFGGQYKFLDKKLSIDFNLTAGHVTNNYALIGNTAGAAGDLISYALNWNPTSNIYATDGSFNLLSHSIPNPVAVTQGFHDQSNVENYLGNISAAYKILPNLEYKFLYSINHSTGVRNTSVDGFLPLQGTLNVGLAAIGTAVLTSATYQNTLNYKAKIATGLNFEIVGGYEYYKTNYSNTNVTNSGFATNLTQQNRTPILYTSIFQSAANIASLNSFADPSVEIQSYFARANFNYLDKYYLVATVRDDGSSKFGSNNKYGVFPSVGAKWVLKNENILKDNTTVSELAIRASWGITGSQSFPAGVSQGQFALNPGGGGQQIDIPNPNLKWEKTTQYDLGVDFGFLNNRISGKVDLYNKNTTDLLFANVPIVPSPNVIRYTNAPVNLINKGIELSMGGAVIQTPDLNWEVDINAAYNKNILKNYPDALIPTGQVNGQGVSGSFAQAIANNQPADVYYLKQFQGYDATGHQIIAAQPSFQGDPNPHVIAGLSTTLTYKKFSLSVNGSGQFGYLIYNNTYNTITNISNLANGKNVASYILGTPESITDGAVASGRYLESGNYFKLRNATITYTIGNIGNYLKNLRVFAGGSNLFVLTKFRGFDPEVNIDKSNGSGYPSRNIEYAPYPTPRMLNFGFTAGF